MLHDCLDWFVLLVCKHIGVRAQKLTLPCLPTGSWHQRLQLSPSLAGDLLCWTVVCERQKRRQLVSPARLVP